MKLSELEKREKQSFDLSPFKIFLSIIAIFFSANLSIARGAAERRDPIRPSILNEILSELRNDFSAAEQPRLRGSHCEQRPANSASLRSSKPTSRYFPDSICTSPSKDQDPNDS